jgi:sugar lactone lactonase YvrE
MSRRELRTLLEGGAFFESPRWHESRWWVSDFYRHLVLAVQEDGRCEEVMQVPGRPSGLGWMPDGSLLVVSMTDKRLLRRDGGGAVYEHADISALCAGLANDMVVDVRGRAYVGNFGFDLYGGGRPATAALVRVDPNGAVSVAADELWFPNGSVILPDERTLIVGETAAARYVAFTIADDGTLRDRRVWAQVAPAPQMGSLQEMLASLRFAPDGCCLDAEGHIWAADALGARACRVAPGGGIVDEIPAPDGLGFFACMLGGGDGRTLLLCAAPDFDERARGAAREALLLSTTVAVGRAGRP